MSLVEAHMQQDEVRDTPLELLNPPARNADAACEEHPEARECSFVDLVPFAWAR